MERKEVNRGREKAKIMAKGCSPKPICPKCGEYMRQVYAHEAINGKRLHVGAGWMCPSSTCDCIVNYPSLPDGEEGASCFILGGYRFFLVHKLNP